MLHNTLLAEGAIDEVYINIEPFMERGLDLAPPDGRHINLELIEHKHIGADIVQIHYKVKK